MTRMQQRSIFILAGVLIALTAWDVYSQDKQEKHVEPFRMLGQQDNPPVTLFEHKPSGTCYLGWKAGGLIAVDTEVCKRHGFFIPIILPPIDTVSPERQP